MVCKRLGSGSRCSATKELAPPHLQEIVTSSLIPGIVFGALALIGAAFFMVWVRTPLRQRPSSQARLPI